MSGLVMTIARGRVTGFTATAGRDAVARELDAAGPAGRAFREFALGFNPLLAIPDQRRALHSVLRLRRRRGAPIVRRQLRAGGQRARRLRALELLHRRDRDRWRAHLGQRRSHDRAMINAPAHRSAHAEGARGNSRTPVSRLPSLLRHRRRTQRLREPVQEFLSLEVALDRHPLVAPVRARIDARVAEQARDAVRRNA